MSAGSVHTLDERVALLFHFCKQGVGKLIEFADSLWPERDRTVDFSIVNLSFIFIKS